MPRTITSQVHNRAAMLRIHQITSPAAAKSYYAHADYYSEGHETQGQWFGDGAARLGLDARGTWDAGHFDRLCDNRHPQTGQRLTARHRANRTVAYDFNFNAPKGVSVLHALTGDRRVQEAFHAAVRDTLRDVECDMKARVRKGKQDAERLTGNLVGAAFVHHTTRPVDGLPDPALHAHAVVFNATWDATEGAWKAGYFRDLKRDAPYWQAAFHARLAAYLRGLGYDTERRGQNWDVKAVTRATVAKFSRRTQQIEDLATRLGVTDPDAKARLGATSRAAKGENRPWLDLVAAWNERLTDDERRALHAARAGATRPVASPARAAESAAHHAVTHLFARRSVVGYRDLLAEALRHGVGHVDVEGVAQALRGRKLIRVQEAGAIRVTTPEVVLEERAILRFARHGQGTRSRLGQRGRRCRRPWLAPDQRAAVDHVLTRPDQVILVRGVAGTGKTTLTQEAVEAIEENGNKVFVLAPSAEASRGVLRAEGFADADTVERFLVDEEWREGARGQVIWVDEAGLLSAPDMARLFAAANDLDARVVLMGDARQHASPNRGAAFRLLQEESGLPCAEVKDIRRQKGAYKEAVKLLSDGRTAEGLAQLDALGWIKEVPGGERDRALAEAYAAALDEGKTALVVSPTHAEGERITAAVRHLLGERGRLGEQRAFRAWKPLHLTEAERADPHAYAPGDMLQFFQHGKGVTSGDRLTVAGEGDAATLRTRDGRDQGFGLAAANAARFGAFRPVGLLLAVGDTIRATAGGTMKGSTYKINNGALFTVRGFTGGGDIVVDHGRVIDKDWGHLTHGYVLTSHASQGKTVDRVFIGQSSLSLPATGREQTYVSASRAREQVVIFTDDKRALVATARRGDERTSATELLRRRRRARWDRVRKHLDFLRHVAGWQRPAREPDVPDRRQGHGRG